MIVASSSVLRKMIALRFPRSFPPKFPDLGSFTVPCVVGKMKIERALCDLGASVSLMPYSMFLKLHLRPLQPTPFSLQLADGSEMRPLGKLEDVPAKVGDIWVLDDFIIADMAERSLMPKLFLVGCSWLIQVALLMQKGDG